MPAAKSLFVPVGGGAITYGASGKFDGVFDLRPYPDQLWAGQIVPANLVTEQRRATRVLQPNGAFSMARSFLREIRFRPSPYIMAQPMAGTIPPPGPHSTTLGLQNGAFSASVFNLNTSTTYYFARLGLKPGRRRVGQSIVEFPKHRANAYPESRDKLGRLAGLGLRSLCWWANRFRHAD